jgi:hypothetical protein
MLSSTKRRAREAPLVLIKNLASRW